jgi:mannose-1-phosphate guanylyltransferase
VSPDPKPIIPVILSGGAGTRLWPMSMPDRPKQFLPLVSDQSMFAETLARVGDARRFGPAIVVANVGHRPHVEGSLDQLARIILEPCARNTAPAIALAAMGLAGDGAMLVMPSDHVIADVAAFHDAIARAAPLVAAGWLVTFGIAASAPETGYGYIQMGETLAEGVNRVARFVEKPDAERASQMIASGDHVWNGGIFMFRADAFLAALEIHAPDILAASQAAFDKAVIEGAYLLPDAGAFAQSPPISIDYAVMEKADKVAVVPVDMGWSDVGSWDALYGLAAHDADSNAITGPVRLSASSGNLVRSNGIRISAHGIDNLIIIADGDEVMIVPRGQSQAVKDFAGGK